MKNGSVDTAVGASAPCVMECYWSVSVRPSGNGVRRTTPHQAFTVCWQWVFSSLLVFRILWRGGPLPTALCGRWVERSDLCPSYTRTDSTC